MKPVQYVCCKEWANNRALIDCNLPIPDGGGSLMAREMGGKEGNQGE